MRYFIFIFSLFFIPAISTAQELNCNVILNYERVQTQQTDIFQGLEQAISNFMNTTKWTQDTFDENEKINCNLMLILGKNSSITNFTATVQVQSSRPVYGTDYESPLLNLFDNSWAFSYQPSEPLIYTENTYATELTALLAFYAFIIIGSDYDSFAPMGGTPFFQRAQNLALIAEQNGAPGWTSSGDIRNRYWISENLNSALFEDYRQAIYEYHRLAMDVYEEDVDKARKTILTCLEKIAKVRKATTSSLMVNAFFDAKASELINIFSSAKQDDKDKAVELLTRLDPQNSSDYKKILKQ